MMVCRLKRITTTIERSRKRIRHDLRCRGEVNIGVDIAFPRRIRILHHIINDSMQKNYRYTLHLVLIASLENPGFKRASEEILSVEGVSYRKTELGEQL